MLLLWSITLDALEMQLQLCPNLKISSLLTKIVLKILWLCLFYGHSVHLIYGAS